jgi:hypothetical protein
MARTRSGARSAPRPSEAESYPRLPPFGAEFSLGPATRSYRSPIVTEAGSGMVVPSYRQYADELGDEASGEAVDHPYEANLLDQSAAEADSTEEDIGSEAEANDVEVEADDVEMQADDVEVQADDVDGER